MTHTECTVHTECVFGAVIGLKWCIKHLITQVKHRCVRPVCFNFISWHFYGGRSPCVTSPHLRDVIHMFVCPVCVCMSGGRRHAVCALVWSHWGDTWFTSVRLRAPDDLTLSKWHNSCNSCFTLWRIWVGGTVLDFWCLVSWNCW